jgi:hypothetical protein
MMIDVFWIVASSSPVEFYLPIRSACCLYYQALMMEAARTSETSVDFYKITRRNNPEESNLLTKNIASITGERENSR